MSERRRRLRGLAIAAALAVGGSVLGACGQDEAPEPAGRASQEPPQGDPAPEGIEGVVVVPAESRSHRSGSIDYDTFPPAGGDHNAVWHNCGFFVEPVPDELAVHSLEHGAVWVAYAEDLDEAQLDVLRARAEAESHLLIAPYPGLRAPLVLSAWERQLDLESVEDPRFEQFLDAYLEGPTAPEPGARCSGGADGTRG